MGSHFLLQEIFLTQRSNLGLLRCKQILYHLRHQGSPKSTLPQFKIKLKITKQNGCYSLSLQTSTGHSVLLEWRWVSQCSLMQVRVRKFQIFRNSQAQIQACTDPQRSRHKSPDLKGHGPVTAKVHDLQLICSFPLLPSFLALH